MLVPFTFSESKTVSNVIRFAGLILVKLGFSAYECYNTSWHRYIRLLRSLALHSETAVHNFVTSQAPQISSEEGELFDFPLIYINIKN